MKILKLTVKAIDTLVNCLVLDNTSTYTDAIDKNKVYVNVSTNSIKVENKCNTDFSLSGKVLFVQTDVFGSTFTATTNTINIPANSEVDIPVYYNGVYKGDSLIPIYSFTINGKVVLYSLTVTELPPEETGTISNFEYTLNNRIDYTFKKLDFTSHYISGGTYVIETVSLTGNVSRLKYNGTTYVSGTDIPLSGINNGLLVHVAPLEDIEKESIINYSIKDTDGNILPSAQIKIKNLEKVVVPASNIYITNPLYNDDEGTMSFQLHVENIPFVGFIHTSFTNGSYNSKRKTVTYQIAMIPLFNKQLQIGNFALLDFEVYEITSVNIPIGVYSVNAFINAVQIVQNEEVFVSGEIKFSNNDVPNSDVITGSSVSYFRLPNIEEEAPY